jgi:23S rRNA pseudouridine2605 synthase
LTDRKNSDGCRLNRYLARAGIASRRKCDLLITQGSVQVNGRTVTVPGYRVTDSDRVTCMGSVVEPQPLRTAVLNKPHGYETTMAEGPGRTVASLLRGLPPGTVPVGRLDINTGGLLLLSNDGSLVNRLTHPSWEVEREYRAFLAAPPDESQLKRLRRGASIAPGEYSRPSSVQRSGDRSVNLVLHTGRNREVRRLFEACRIPLAGLERVRFGPVTLKGVKRGEYRILSPSELSELRRIVGLSEDNS